jgi:hypothetical protein
MFFWLLIIHNYRGNPKMLAFFFVSNQFCSGAKRAQDHERGANAMLQQKTKLKPDKEYLVSVRSLVK